MRSEAEGFECCGILRAVFKEDHRRDGRQCNGRYWSPKVLPGLEEDRSEGALTRRCVSRE